MDLATVSLSRSRRVSMTILGNKIEDDELVRNFFFRFG